MYMCLIKASKNQEKKQNKTKELQNVLSKI